MSHSEHSEHEIAMSAEIRKFGFFTWLFIAVATALVLLFALFALRKLADAAQPGSYEPSVVPASRRSVSANP